MFQRITWNPSVTDRELCLLKGKSEVINDNSLHYTAGERVETISLSSLSRTIAKTTSECWLRRGTADYLFAAPTRTIPSAATTAPRDPPATMPPSSGSSPARASVPMTPGTTLPRSTRVSLSLAALKPLLGKIYLTSANSLGFYNPPPLFKFYIMLIHKIGVFLTPSPPLCGRHLSIRAF